MSEPESKKKRKHDDMLYTPVWECPVCFHQLGKDAGFVPMLIASCRPLAHMVCYQCSASLPLKNCADGTQQRFCPVCNEPAGEFVPVSSVVDLDADPEARAALDQFEYNRKRTVVKPKDVINALPIIVQRVEFVYNRALQEIANYAGGGSLFTMVFFHNNVPLWDAQNVRLISSQRGFRRVTRAQLEQELKNICQQLQVHLDTLMADSQYRIVMGQSMVKSQSWFVGPKDKFVYLPFQIKPRLPAPF